MNSLVASNWIGGRKGAASSTAIGTSAGRLARTAASWAVSACSTGAQISRVIGGGRLANAFAPRRHQLLASVNEVTLRIVAGEQYRRRRPPPVRPRPAHPPQR